MRGRFSLFAPVGRLILGRTGDEIEKRDFGTISPFHTGDTPSPGRRCCVLLPAYCAFWLRPEREEKARWEGVGSCVWEVKGKTTIATFFPRRRGSFTETDPTRQASRHSRPRRRQQLRLAAGRAHSRARKHSRVSARLRYNMKDTGSRTAV